jgi:hypothetical protein
MGKAVFPVKKIADNQWYAYVPLLSVVTSYEGPLVWE